MIYRLIISIIPIGKSLIYKMFVRYIYSILRHNIIYYYNNKKYFVAFYFTIIICTYYTNIPTYIRLPNRVNNRV